MKTLPVYSSLFTCLHDEPEPVGSLGRGAHYSVLRSVEWLDVTRTPLKKPQVHDFAVIWDEDHDTRVIDAIDAIYMEGLLSPVQFIGERKGNLTVIVAAKFYFDKSDSELKAYQDALKQIAATANDDVWNFELGFFDRSPYDPFHQTDVQGIIAAEQHRVLNYLRTVDSLWSLGTKDWKRSTNNWAMPGMLGGQPTPHSGSVPPLPTLPAGVRPIPVPPAPSPAGWPPYPQTRGK